MKDNIKYKGARKSGKRFIAREIDGKEQRLGTFDTAKEAAEAHNRACIQAGHPTSKLKTFLIKYPRTTNRRIMDFIQET